MGVPGLPASKIETGRARRPQFIRLLYHNWMEKMPIPAEFLKRRYISDEELNRGMATFVTPFRDFWHIDLEKDGSDVFFAGNWPKFLEFQGITEGEGLLIRYQGNMIFTIEVFGFTGSWRKLEKQGIRFQQTENSENTNSSQEIEQSEEANSSHGTGQSEEASSSQETEEGETANSSQKTVQSEEANSSQKTATSSTEAQSKKEAQISSRKRKQREEKRVPKSSTNPIDKRARQFCEYEIGPQAWLRKQLNTYTLERFLPLPGGFCKNVGLQKNCKITLKSSESNRSWETNGKAYKTGIYHLMNGWKIFCRDNGLKEGDVCTFNVLKSNLWRVDIERC